MKFSLKFFFLNSYFS